MFCYAQLFFSALSWGSVGWPSRLVIAYFPNIKNKIDVFGFLLYTMAQNFR